MKLPKGQQLRTGVSDELVELVDFYATAAELACLPCDHTQFGHSLLPYAMKQETSLREGVVCEGGFRIGEEQCRLSETKSLPKKSHKYYPRISLQMDADEMWNGKAIMFRTKSYKYIHRLYEQDELYDLEKDPQEIHNVIQVAAYQPVAARMREQLLTHYLDTSDVVPMQLDARFDQRVITKTAVNVGKRIFKLLRRGKR